LGDATFERAWTDGSAMSLDEVIEMGLEPSFGITAEARDQEASLPNSLTTG
jgi:hypothetical protein